MRFSDKLTNQIYLSMYRRTKGTGGFPSPPILSHCLLSLNLTVGC